MLRQVSQLGEALQSLKQQLNLPTHTVRSQNVRRRTDGARLMRDYRISCIWIRLRNCNRPNRVQIGLIVHPLQHKPTRRGGQIEDLSANIAGFGRTDQCLSNIALSTRKISVIKICKTQLPLSAILPLCVSEGLCQGRYLRPITTHRRRIAFPVEITFNDETEHSKLFISLQERIPGEFLT